MKGTIVFKVQDRAIDCRNLLQDKARGVEDDAGVIRQQIVFVSLKRPGSLAVHQSQGIERHTEIPRQVERIQQPPVRPIRHHLDADCVFSRLQKICYVDCQASSHVSSGWPEEIRPDRPALIHGNRPLADDGVRLHHELDRTAVGTFEGTLITNVKFGKRQLGRASEMLRKDRTERELTEGQLVSQRDGRHNSVLSWSTIL